ncbi:MAG TPA: M14 metallopeptidase family protein [Gemmatimonadaceae bacterium]|nr:M14 metallopeptidase family protein [Gemmatimonadaceae bacterium]
MPSRFTAFTRAVAAVAAVALLLSSAAGAGRAQSAGVLTPREQLGFGVGEDRKLADWAQITGYFARLAAASPAVRVDTLGPTTQGRPLIVATISTPENLRRLDEIRALQARLADPRTLSADDERRAAAGQPLVVMITCNIHSSEIASSQMAMELAHRLATVDTLQGYLRNVVLLLVPSLNPDGENMVTEWYRKNVGTRWEGGPMPWLYHPYVGHDNNRDWYMVTQKETRLVTDLLYRRWFPEIFYDVHQQGSYGMRITVPPHVDPIDPNVDALIVRGINHIGAEMSLALESRGKTGVGDGVTYDLWWHGGARSTPTRHNMVGLLTEAASARVASPLEIAPSRLRGHERGLPRYERRVNFPNPWPGGTWRLRDIVDYELIAAEALVKVASDQRETYLRNFVSLGRKQLRLGETDSVRAYVIPSGQHDPSAAAELVKVLRVGGVEVYSAPRAITVGGRSFAAGSYVIPMAQPYRAHAKDLLEVQRFPKMERWPGGPVERPYDVAGWTLPMQMGVRVEALAEAVPTQGLAMVPVDLAPRWLCEVEPPARFQNTACYTDLPLQLRIPEARRGLPRRLPRVALYRPWTGSMDEGWTRWVLEQFKFPFTNVSDSVIKAGNLRTQYDVVLIADMSYREARNGLADSVAPPPYAGGLGDAGLGQLKRFVEAGGTVVTLDRASEIATRALGVDVKRITVRQQRDDEDVNPSAPGSSSADTTPKVDPVYAPGSILRILVDRTHPVANGMPDTAAVYFTNSNTFDVPAGSRARVIARYPSRGSDILLSGFLQGENTIAGKAAAVEVPVGQGRVVMFGFRPQYRAQSWGTFRMLFNALLMGAGS